MFFDNLQVTHYRGPLTEETHYYPFGLTMAGISSKAGNILENKRKFNSGTELANKEFSDGSGVEWYNTDFRRYDHQIGRFLGIDALSELNLDVTPYSFALNNPILLNDPYGLIADSAKNPSSKPPPETSTPDNPKILEEVVVGTNPASVEFYMTIKNLTTAAGYYGLGWDAWYNTRYKGDWKYRNYQGKITSIFDTKYGANKTPDYLGNVNRYSENARKSIRVTRVVKVVKVGSKVVVYLSTALDYGKALYAYVNDDPKAADYLVKAGVNTGVLILSASLPGAGWLIGGIYFLGDELIDGGWGRVMDESNQNILNNREITPNWNPRPGGGLGN